MSQSCPQSNELWIEFISKIHGSPSICYEKIKSYIKIKNNNFPTDSIVIDYYERIFSKITSAAHRTKWHEMDKFLLIWCVAKLLQLRNKEQLIPEQEDWEYISQLLNVNKQLLELKWLTLLHSNLQIKQWTKEEDEKLISICNNLLQKNNWTEITLKFNQVSSTQRYPKQIRERFNNVLNPNLYKTEWKQEEQEKLVELINNNGKKWSKISQHFVGRSENQLKSQYCKLKKFKKIQNKIKHSKFRQTFSEINDQEINQINLPKQKENVIQSNIDYKILDSMKYDCKIQQKCEAIKQENFSSQQVNNQNQINSYYNNQNQYIQDQQYYMQPYQHYSNPNYYSNLNQTYMQHQNQMRQEYQKSYYQYNNPYNYQPNRYYNGANSQQMNYYPY